MTVAGADRRGNRWPINTIVDGMKKEHHTLRHHIWREVELSNMSLNQLVSTNFQFGSNSRFNQICNILFAISIKYVELTMIKSRHFSNDILESFDLKKGNNIKRQQKRYAWPGAWCTINCTNNRSPYRFAPTTAPSFLPRSHCVAFFHVR